MRTMNKSIKLGMALIALTMVAALAVLYATHWHVALAQWGLVLGAIVAFTDTGFSRSIRRLALVPVFALLQMACWMVFWVLVLTFALTSFPLVLTGVVLSLVVSKVITRSMERWAIVPKETTKKSTPGRWPTLAEALLIGTMALALCVPIFAPSVHFSLNISGILLGSFLTWAIIHGERRFHRLEWLPFVAAAQMVCYSFVLGQTSLMWLLYLVPCTAVALVLSFVLARFVVGSEESE